VGAAVVNFLACVGGAVVAAVVRSTTNTKNHILITVFLLLLVCIVDFLNGNPQDIFSSSLAFRNKYFHFS
jgi:hypothetical protein